MRAGLGSVAASVISSRVLAGAVRGAEQGQWAQAKAEPRPGIPVSQRPSSSVPRNFCGLSAFPKAHKTPFSCLLSPRVSQTDSLSIAVASAAPQRPRAGCRIRPLYLPAPGSARRRRRPFPRAGGCCRHTDQARRVAWGINQLLGTSLGSRSQRDQQRPDSAGRHLGAGQLLLDGDK